MNSFKKFSVDFGRFLIYSNRKVYIFAVVINIGGNMNGDPNKKILEEQFMEFIKPAGELPPLVDLNDVGKEAVIRGIGFAETKFGRRLRVVVEFKDGTSKSVLLSKTFARALHKAFEGRGFPSIKDWIGLRVKIEKVATQVKGRLIEKAMITPM